MKYIFEYNTEITSCTNCPLANYERHAEYIALNNNTMSGTTMIERSEVRCPLLDNRLLNYEIHRNKSHTECPLKTHDDNAKQLK